MIAKCILTQHKHRKGEKVESEAVTFQELLEVVHKKLSQRRPFGSLQSVDELLNFGRDSAADGNACTGPAHVHVSMCVAAFMFH